MTGPVLDGQSEGSEEAFRLRLRVGPDDLLFEPLSHCRNTNERGRMLLTYALQGYLATVGIQLGQQLLAVTQAGGLVATMSDLRALAGSGGLVSAPPVSTIKSGQPMHTFTPPAAGSGATSVPMAEDSSSRYDVSGLGGLDALAFGDAVQI